MTIQSVRTVLTFLTVLFASAAVLPGSAYAQPARQSPNSFDYNGENPPPDYLVFKHYLSVISGLPDDAPDGPGKHEITKVHYVLHSFNLSHDKDGHNSAEQLVRDFEKLDQQMNFDIAEAEYELFCSSNLLENPDAQVYETMDRIYSDRDQIAEKYYLDTMANLDSNFRVRLDNALQENKKSLQISRIPHKDMYTDSGVSAKTSIAKLCKKISRKRKAR